MGDPSLQQFLIFEGLVVRMDQTGNWVSLELVEVLFESLIPSEGNWVVHLIEGEISVVVEVFHLSKPSQALL